MLRKIWRKVKKTVKKVVRTAKAVAHRIAGVVDLTASLFGIRPEKHLRLKVLILTDTLGQPMQTEQEVERWLNETKRIFKDRMNVVIQAPDTHFPIIGVIEEPAPPEAVFATCGVTAAFSDASDYFDDHCTYTKRGVISFLLDAIGYGEAMYAFVVHNIDEGSRNGCAFPVVQDYCLVERNPRTTTLAHEMCHLGGLSFPNEGHRSEPDNLMNITRDDLDSDLTRWQISVVRSSRYVTYFRL